MSADALDRILSSFAEIDSIPRNEIDARITKLRDEVRLKSTQIRTLEALRSLTADDEEANNHSQRVRRKAPEVVRGLAASVNSEGIDRPAADTRPQTWKRDAVLALLDEDPSRVWSPAEVRHELIRRDVMESDEGTPMGQQLTRMARRGEIAGGDGAYWSAKRDQSGLSLEG